MGSEWTYEPIGNHVTVSQGLAINKESRHLLEETGLPLLRITDLISNTVSQFVNAEKVPKKCVARPNELIYTRTGQVGLVFRKRVGVVHNNCFKVIPKESIDVNFLYWYLSQEKVKDYVNSVASGSVQKDLNHAAFFTLSIPVPSLREQRRISKILDDLDDKIELNRKMNETLEAMARALFKSWFVDFDPVRAKLDGRPPVALDPAAAALFPENLEDSVIGKKPIGWEVTVLETAMSVLEVGGRPKGGVGGITSGIPSIGAESILGVGQFDFGKTKYVPVEFFEGMKKGHIQSHDVLLYKDGGRPGEYEPHVSMFSDGFPFEKCSINEHVYRLRTNERLSQEYLYFWLTSEMVLSEMRVKGTGVAIPGLNSTAVRSLTTLVPPKPIVDAFTEQAAPLVTRIVANSKQSRTLATLRDTLLPGLMSGGLSLEVMND